jgi:hypothetical protein
MCRLPACSSTPLARCLQMPMAPTEREVRLKHFCIGAWKRWRRPRGVSASTCRCQWRSTVWEGWRSISYAPTRGWRWSSTARSISRIQSRIGATGIRIGCYRKMDILVLRFLAEDVGRELDVVLDAILRALSHRQLTAPPVVPLSFVRRSQM